MKDTNILAVDTSGKTLSVAILKNDSVIEKYNENTGLTHSETLLVKIIEIFEKCNMNLSCIDYFVCANGPGSFTGLRIGIATMKALAQTQNKPMVEVSVLRGLYENVKDKFSLVCPIIDARREEVYGAVYKNGETLLDDTPVLLVNLIEFLKKYNEPVCFLGDGAVSYKERIVELMGDKAVFPIEEDILQKGESVGKVGFEKISKGEVTTAHNFKVNYLKPSQPEMKK